MLLQLSGHDVPVAHNGETAVRIAKSKMTEVVLLDLGLPQMNGYDACRAMRSNANGKPMRIVALTGWGHAEDRAKTKAAGFDEHMVKPVEPEKLIQMLAS